RRVIASTLRRRASGKLAQYRDESRIKDRNEQNQNRHSQNRHEAARTPAAQVDQRGAREKEPDEHRTAVAHEDRCGIRVVNQKSEQPAGEDEQDQSFSKLTAVHKAER